MLTGTRARIIYISKENTRNRMPRGIPGSGTATLTAPTARSGTQQGKVIWQGMSLTYQAKPANNVWGFDVAIQGIDGSVEFLSQLCPKAMGLVQSLFNQYGVLAQFGNSIPTVGGGVATQTHTAVRRNRGNAVNRRSQLATGITNNNTT